MGASMFRYCRFISWIWSLSTKETLISAESLKPSQLEHRVAAAADEHADARGDLHRFLLV